MYRLLLRTTIVCVVVPVIVGDYLCCCVDVQVVTEDYHCCVVVPVIVGDYLCCCVDVQVVTEDYHCCVVVPI